MENKLDFCNSILKHLSYHNTLMTAKRIWHSKHTTYLSKIAHCCFPFGVEFSSWSSAQNNPPHFQHLLHKRLLALLVQQLFNILSDHLLALPRDHISHVVSSSDTYSLVLSKVWLTEICILVKYMCWSPFGELFTKSHCWMTHFLLSQMFMQVLLHRFYRILTHILPLCLIFLSSQKGYNTP